MIQIKYLIAMVLVLAASVVQAQTNFWQHSWEGVPTPDQKESVVELPTRGSVELPPRGRIENAVVTNLLFHPLLFERNIGQVDGTVEYFSKTASGITYFFTKEGVTIVLTKHSREKEMTLAHSLKVRFVGANAKPTITAEDQAQSVTNYFRGKDPAKWIKHVPNYQKIRYTNIYDGIDLVYYRNGKKLEYDFVVHPGVDPNVIRIKYEGAEDGLKLLENGSVEIATSIGMMNEMKPVAYQPYRHSELGSESEPGIGAETSSARRIISADWKFSGTNELQFSLGEYDHSQTLYIDPLLYSTYIGSNHEEVAMDIAVDGDSNAYIMGYTTSPNFPTTAGAFDTSFNAARMDVFISKLNASGNGLVFSTFLGGNDAIPWGYSGPLFWDRNGIMWIYGGIALDRSGNILVAGFTDGADFPTTPGAFSEIYSGGAHDIFLTKLRSSGDSLLFSTYLGGGDDEQLYAHGVVADTFGNAYVTGYTGSNDFPVTPGAFITQPFNCTKGFITKFSTEGSLIYSTFLNGTIDNTYTICTGIVVDNDGNAYVTGYTNQTDFPTTLGAYDTSSNGYAEAFISKMNTTGSGVIFSTYIGGGLDDEGVAITLDHHRDVYITGFTTSPNYPTTFGAFDRSFNGSGPSRTDAFVTKLDSSGSSLVYSTFLGKSGYDFGVDIALDTNNSALIFGTTSGPEFPTTPGAYDVTFNGVSGSDNAGDCFLTKFNLTGSLLLYSTFLGGSNYNKSAGMALDNNGNAYLTGSTLSSDFPTTPGAFDVSFNDSADVFVTKLSPFIPANVTIKKVMDYDGLMATENDRQPKSWSLKLYSGSIDPGNLVASTTSDSMYVPNLVVGTYIAVEEDSSEWLPIGKIINNIPYASASHTDTFSLGSGDARVITFINFQPRIVIRKYSDGDGNFATIGDRYLMTWHLRLYHDTIAPENLVTEATSAESLIVSGLATGTYIAVESDSNGWYHIGTIIDGVPSAGSQDTVAINYTSGEFHQVEFINYGPNAITIRKLYDADGNIATTGDRTPKKWNLSLYKSAAHPDSLIQTVASAESMRVENLGMGIYIAAEADSSEWSAIGKVRDGITYPGSYSKDTISVSGGQSVIVDFVNAYPTVTVKKLKDEDGIFSTSNDRTPVPWTLTLYRGSISPGNIVTPSISTPESLVFNKLSPNTYIAYESDSVGWRHLGTILDGVGAANTANTITFTVIGSESHTAEFVNAASNQVTIRKYRDDDGDFTTTGDRTAKSWGFKLYRNSISLANLIDSVASTAVWRVKNLAAGTYVAVEADSGDRWQHIATVFDGSSSGGTQNNRTFTIAEGEAHFLDFINFDKTRGKIWMATMDCEWSNGDNWEPPGIPLPGDTIIVPPTAPCSLEIPDGATVGTINVASQETIYVSPNGTFNCSGDLVVNGTMIAPSNDTSNITVSGNWQVNDFYAGKSIVKLNGTTTQIIDGRDGTFYKLCFEPSTNIVTKSGFKVQELLVLDSDLNAEGDTIEILNSSTGAIAGTGKILRGTLKRAIQQGSTTQYRFESEQSYVQFTGTGTYPEHLTITSYPDTTLTDSEEWTIVSSTVDTIDNTVTTNDLTKFSKWAFGIPRPRVTAHVSRLYEIYPKGGQGYSANLTLRYAQGEVPTGLSEDSLVLLRSIGDFYPSNINKGWNMISVPVQVSDNRVSTLFPMASSSAFSYSPGTGYVKRDSLNNGTGYWLKFSSDKYVAIYGNPRVSDTIEVVEGWNMIGTLSEDVDVNTVVTVPSGIQSSSFYGYDNGYTQETVLEPMKAYWIKVNQTGELLIETPTIFIKKSVNILNMQSRLKNLSIIEFVDVTGNEQRLYFTESKRLEGIEIDLFELPPKPPEGIFDVRYSTGRMLEVAGKETKDYPIQISSAEYPITLRWELKDATQSASLIVDGQVISLSKTGATDISNPRLNGGQAESEIKLRLAAASSIEIPKEFALHQNYPNPFNPITTIKYDLPVESKVKLVVYNVLGQEVKILVDESASGGQDAGYKSVELRIDNLASGVYFYRLETTSVENVSRGHVTTRKMIIMK